jgi:hypothetical protein
VAGTSPSSFERAKYSALAFRILLTEDGTQKVRFEGALLQSKSLCQVPEIAVDLTRESGGTQKVKYFLYEEEIEPHQIGECKVEAHREFIRQWAAVAAWVPSRCGGPGRSA